jgi:hypothetical protein
MLRAVTSEEVDEIEQLLRLVHNAHTISSAPVETCLDPKCCEWRISIAWLRAQIRSRKKISG